MTDHPEIRPIPKLAGGGIVPSPSPVHGEIDPDEVIVPLGDGCVMPGQRLEIPGGYMRFDVPLGRERAEEIRRRFLEEPEQLSPARIVHEDLLAAAAAEQRARADRRRTRIRTVVRVLLVALALVVLTLALHGDDRTPVDLPDVAPPSATPSLPPAPVATPVPAPEPSPIVITWETR